VILFTCHPYCKRSRSKVSDLSYIAIRTDRITKHTVIILLQIQSHQAKTIWTPYLEFINFTIAPDPPGLGLAVLGDNSFDRVSESQLNGTNRRISAASYRKKENITLIPWLAIYHIFHVWLPKGGKQIYSKVSLPFKTWGISTEQAKL